MRHNIVGAYQPIELLRKNGIGWNIHGDLVFSIDKSAGDSFVDEMYVLSDNHVYGRHQLNYIPIHSSTPGVTSSANRKLRRSRTNTGDEMVRPKLVRHFAPFENLH
jgi:hypothetical protein